MLFKIYIDESGDEPPEIIFSNRKQLKLNNFINYLNHLKNLEKKSSIQWDFLKIDSNHINSASANQLVGLQFADCFATAFRNYGFEINSFGAVETSYVQILKPLVYHQNNNYKSNGLKILGNTTKCCEETKNLLKFYNIEV